MLIYIYLTPLFNDIIYLKGGRTGLKMQGFTSVLVRRMSDWRTVSYNRLFSHYVPLPTIWNEGGES